MSKDVVQLAVVGLGHWGQNVLRSFAGAKRCQLHAVCDRRSEVLAQQSALYPWATATEDYQSVLGDPAVEAVAVATPAPLHFEMARLALEADKHVFVEKPLTLLTEQAEELDALARRRERTLMVGHLLEYHPAVALMKEQIDGGHLGRIHYMYCQRLNLGVVRASENAFWSLAPHDISVILHLFGAEPDGVTAAGACFLQPGIEDVVFANLHFADGRIAQIHVSWLDPHKERKMVVVGSEKMLVFDDMHPTEKIRIFDKGASPLGPSDPPLAPVTVRHGDIHIPHLSGRAPLDIETQHFIDCILDGTTPRSDGRDGVRVVRVLEQVEQELHGGRVFAGAVRSGKRPAENGGGHDYFVHPSAYVDEGVRIGRGTSVWHFCHLMAGAVVGGRCRIGQNVVIGPGVQIGNGVKIQNNVSVYQGVTLEDDVFCGPSMVFTNVLTPRSAFPRNRPEDCWPTRVCRGASIGANATVVCGHTIGAYALVGAGAVVTRDVPPHAVVYGNPARRHGWACECGVVLAFEGSLARCQECGRSYGQSRGGIEVCEPACGSLCEAASGSDPQSTVCFDPQSTVCSDPQSTARFDPEPAA